ncbi:class I SAM-dependent methyltransferase [Pseudomonas aeruginosa]|uniref:class I SAM-dependent methyltransferase n=1 Tax=Pseudomonas aeruginosa TaxID=287 RepID=UPI001F2028C4|nr:class I SAM-dependent methyltransferase [Pseudomonas aeruginosa]MDG4275140.1 class I SAM-dependent methyltransferase [Pseudomonas aeruginosa]HCF5875147.1 class I SAM-dependent methyltransferase [Pseudomonas aeruginosa]
MSLDDIDFAERYRQHMRLASYRPKPASEWDKRALAMDRKPLGGPYTDAFIARMDLDGARSLLDIGCGPGTLCLPLAPRLEAVHALDYSPAMLALLNDNAEALGLDNVHPVLRAWEDDWSDLPVCDILVASRSGLVEDLDATLDKIHRHTRLRVYMTQLVGGQFIDPVITRLLGLEQPAFPDYIYTLNLLHRRGIHPRLDYIEVSSRLAGCKDFDEFATRVS